MLLSLLLTEHGGATWSSVRDVTEVSDWRAPAETSTARSREYTGESMTPSSSGDHLVLVTTDNTTAVPATDVDEHSAPGESE